MTRGFALLIVLWTMVLLALLVSQISAAGRSEAELAGNLRGSAVAEAAADGAEATALFRYLDPSALHWPTDGAWHRLVIGDAEVAVTLIDEDGRVNPNNAPVALLTALLRRIGVDPGAAAGIAAAMVDWRSPGPVPSPLGPTLAQYRAAGMAWGPPGGPFQSTEELALVRGMTPAIVNALRPHISLYTVGQPDPALADPLVRAALADANGGTAPPPNGGSGARTLEITAQALESDGARFTRTSVVRIDPTSAAVLTLAWGQGGG